MKEFTETKDLSNHSANEVENRTKAFENTSQEVKEPVHIKTINEDLARQNYPGS